MDKVKIIQGMKDTVSKPMSVTILPILIQKQYIYFIYLSHITCTHTNFFICKNTLMQIRLYPLQTLINGNLPVLLEQGRFINLLYKELSFPPCILSMFQTLPQYQEELEKFVRLHRLLGSGQTLRGL